MPLSGRTVFAIACIRSQHARTRSCVSASPFRSRNCTRSKQWCSVSPSGETGAGGSSQCTRTICASPPLSLSLSNSAPMTLRGVRRSVFWSPSPAKCCQVITISLFSTATVASGLSALLMPCRLYVQFHAAPGCSHGPALPGPRRALGPRFRRRPFSMILCPPGSSARASPPECCGAFTGGVCALEERTAAAARFDCSPARREASRWWRASSTTRREMNTSASPGEDSAMQKWASAG
mmetsp:Transcript_34093/g.79711  ORF Transcript_34093/g.79711 Transcript_34093/m.79711 type:complete len:237 (+) Transcript_34093:132-842(+)